MSQSNDTKERAAPSAWQIEQAMAIAASVKQRLLADDPDLAADEELLSGMLDGETDALALVRRLVRFSLDAQSLADAADERAKSLNARRDRFKRRAEAARGAAFGMMIALDQKKLADPEFTAWISAGRSAVIVTDADALPGDFVRIERSPDKVAIKAALEAGQSVPGAELSNSSPILTVRSK